ncbi:hypothetical protein [Paenibacillus donghaensis]|uniref:Uncharacterized protein n=1 Tax=Paenibacillus donghaensis TaxID=414771 RepID=A0A2Z2KDH2_9BACL|nr:hypothetical protein [Paenibacillus donghaensis]ASA21845.1 hypothetical protein B9T62_14305 [Paenibacillus donghaensis]
MRRQITCYEGGIVTVWNVKEVEGIGPMQPFETTVNVMNVGEGNALIFFFSIEVEGEVKPREFSVNFSKVNHEKSLAAIANGATINFSSLDVPRQEDMIFAELQLYMIKGGVGCLLPNETIQDAIKMFT